MPENLSEGISFVQRIFSAGPLVPLCFGGAIILIVIGVIKFPPKPEAEQVPAPAKQEIKSTGPNSPAIGTINGPVQFNNYGSTLTKEDLREAIESAVQKKMAEVEKVKGPDLAKIYPNGYTIFTITEQRNIVPFKGPEGSTFEVDWSKAGVSSGGSTVTLTLPDIEINNFHGITGLKFNGGNQITIPRQVGAKAEAYQVDNVVLCMEIVALPGEGTVVVFGAQENNRPRPTANLKQVRP